MDNHPIPQDVTGFQFKLIGDMTLKQFLYLAASIITGWVLLSLPLGYLISIPVAILVIIAGVSLAFIPVAGRPVDIMLLNFLKSIFAPTQYVYKKFDSKDYALSQSQLPLPPQTTQPHITTPSTEQAVGLKIDEKKSKELQKKEGDLKEKLKEMEEKEKNLKEKELSVNQGLSQEAHQKLLALEDEVQEMRSQREQLSKQISTLQKTLVTQRTNIFKASMAKPTPQTPNVRKIPVGMGKELGLPTAPTVANMVTGIVKDPRGKPLANILVEIKDKEDNPIRAFKTSQLGHFASATPLPNGTYVLILEDPKGENRFDAIELSAKNELIMPIEIVSIDQREELRRSLFGHKA